MFGPNGDLDIFGGTIADYNNVETCEICMNSTFIKDDDTGMMRCTECNSAKVDRAQNAELEAEDIWDMKGRGHATTI